jgi:hypothetical protein
VEGVSVSEDADSITFDAGGLSARIGKRPFSLTFLDGQKKLTFTRENHLGVMEVAGDESYKNVPFLLTNQGFGVFVQDPGKVEFEVMTERVSAIQMSVPRTSSTTTSRPSGRRTNAVTLVASGRAQSSPTSACPTRPVAPKIHASTPNVKPTAGFVVRKTLDRGPASNAEWHYLGSSKPHTRPPRPSGMQASPVQQSLAVVHACPLATQGRPPVPAVPPVGVVPPAPPSPALPPVPPVPPVPHSNAQTSATGRQRPSQHSPGSTQPSPALLHSPPEGAASKQRFGNCPAASGGRGSAQVPETH